MDKSIISMVRFGPEICAGPFAEILNFNLICIHNFFFVVFICSIDLISYQFSIFGLSIQILFVSRKKFVHMIVIQKHAYFQFFGFRS